MAEIRLQCSKTSADAPRNTVTGVSVLGGRARGEWCKNVSPYSCEYAPRNSPGPRQCAPLHKYRYSSEVQMSTDLPFTRVPEYYIQNIMNQCMQYRSHTKPENAGTGYPVP
eukprot:2066759-Rhodomonas_salina.2